MEGRILHWTLEQVSTGLISGESPITRLLIPLLATSGCGCYFMPHEKSPQNTVCCTPDHDAVRAALGLSKTMGTIRLKWRHQRRCGGKCSVL